MSTILDVVSVSKGFGGVAAVSDVTVGVERGEIFGLIGPNGAGKTTLVNLITAYLRPDHGRIQLGDHELVGQRPHRLARLGIARTYQNLQLFEGSTVLENVIIGRHLAFGGRLWQLGLRRHREERSQHAASLALIERLGLADVADASPAELSYGMRRRVEIARALATEPKLLLLDEPTAGMTRTESDEIGELLQAINAEGTTVVLVDHNVRLITAVCHRVAVLDWGRLLALGEARTIFEDERVVAAYLGRKREAKALSSVEGVGKDESVAP